MHVHVPKYPRISIKVLPLGVSRKDSGELRRSQGQEHAKKKLMQDDPVFRQTADALSQVHTNVSQAVHTVREC